MSDQELDGKILDILKTQMVLNYHPSRIVTKNDMKLALDSEPFLSSISSGWNLEDRAENISEAKKLVKKYDKYVFQNEALHFIQKFLNHFHANFPTKESLLNKFTLYSDRINKLWTIKDYKVNPIIFKPKVVTIDPKTNLYLTTNAFQLFERNSLKSKENKGLGTPMGATWFSIEDIYDPEKTLKLHSERGAMRVIKYNFINEPKTNLEKYPFLDGHIKIVMPRIMDARKIDHIPKEVLDEYFKQKGIPIEFNEPNMDKNILSQYGRTFRPFVIDYLKSFGLDGVIVKNNELALFEPERWIRFEDIEQADPMYLALSELMNTFENIDRKNDLLVQNFYKFNIPMVAEKNGVDRKSLEILFHMNTK
jgi:hypothetical protein